MSTARAVDNVCRLRPDSADRATDRTTTSARGGAVKPQASRVTLIDVAAASGVSASTVSRVLHGGAGVRDEVAARVRVTADALGYSVNQQARSLRRGRDEAIGIVVEDFTVPF